MLGKSCLRADEEHLSSLLRSPIIDEGQKKYNIIVGASGLDRAKSSHKDQNQLKGFFL